MERAVSLTKAVEAFGGYSELARRLKVPLSTCHSWKSRKKLPEWRADQIRALAKAERPPADVFTSKRHTRRRRAH
jgi:uncharacterized protein YjcR